MEILRCLADGCPACAIIPAPGVGRRPQYVGEDTKLTNVYIRFYQQAYRKSGETTDIAAGYSRLNAQLEKAQALLRADPTFNNEYVSSDITYVDPLLQG
jgi:hypothetical protein